MEHNTRKHYIAFVEYVWTSILFLLLLFCSLSAAASDLHYASQSQDTSKPQYGGDYRAPLASEPATLDPAYYTDIYSVNVATNIFDGLVEFDQDLNIVPAIAKRWKISRDYRTYTFLLRESVAFHNGREVTADDFVFSFSRLLDPNTQSPFASFFLNISGAKSFHEGKSHSVSGLSAPSPYVLKIELEQPFAPFLSILAMANAKVIPQEEVGPEFARNPVGTGPFRFRTWEPEKAISLDANPDYFAGKPFLDSLTFRIYPNIDWEKMFDDFKNDLLEHALIPSDQYELTLEKTGQNTHYTIVSKPGLNLVYVGMNTSMQPFNDPRVRQAINYAVDTDAIVTQITKRNSTPIKGILPPGIAGFDPNFKGYPYDPQKARQLLAEAGYPKGQNFPPVAIWTVSKSDSVQKELQAYQRYLAAIGIELSLHVAGSWKEFIAAINEQKTAMFYAAWYADYPDPDNFFYPLIHSSSTTNRMRFHDPKVDQLLNQARQEMDYIKRVDIYRDIEQLVTHSAPIISQHVNSNNYLFRSTVKGADVNPLGTAYLPFRKVWFDREQSISTDLSSHEELSANYRSP